MFDCVDEMTANTALQYVCFTRLPTRKPASQAKHTVLTGENSISIEVGKANQRFLFSAEGRQRSAIFCNLGQQASGATNKLKLEL